MMTLREARWWVLIGVAWAILSSPILLYPPIRETIYLAIGNAIRYLLFLTPIVWAGLILDAIYPANLPNSALIVPMLFFGVILGGLAGYILRIIFKAITGR